MIAAASHAHGRRKGLRGTVIALAGTLAISGCGPIASKASHAAPAASILGPYGYDGLRLGMSEAQLRAAGKVVLKAPRTNGDGCAQYVWKRDPKGRAALFVSEFGLESIFPDNRAARTPENIGVGSSESQVRSAYRNAEHPIPVLMYAPTPHNPKGNYDFLMDSRGTVIGITLIRNPSQCGDDL